MQNGEAIGGPVPAKVQASETLESARVSDAVLGGGGTCARPGRADLSRGAVNAIGGGSEEIMRDLAARQLGL